MVDTMTETMETMVTTVVMVPTMTTDIETMSTTAVTEKVGNATKSVAKMNLEDIVEMETGGHNKGK